MEENKSQNEKTTRSGRRFSGCGQKRAREPETSSRPDCGDKKKKKMATEPDPKLESLKTFFSNELDKKLKTNREEIIAENAKSVGIWYLVFGMFICP